MNVNSREYLLDELNKKNKNIIILDNNGKQITKTNGEFDNIFISHMCLCTNCHRIIEARPYSFIIEDSLKRRYCSCVTHGYSNISLREIIVYYYLKKYFNDTIHDFNIDGYSFDIFIPKFNTVIEYDGKFHQHNYNIELDNQKNDICLNHGYQIIRIREPGCPSLIPKQKYIEIKLLKENSTLIFENCLRQIFEILDSLNKYEFNINKDILDIFKLKGDLLYQKSLAYRIKNITEWWDYENNLKTPQEIGAKSGQKVWLKCPICGREWVQIVKDITGDGIYCKKCGSHLS